MIFATVPAPVPSLDEKDWGIHNVPVGSAKTRWLRASRFRYDPGLTREAGVLPRYNGELKVSLADYQRPVDEAEDLLGYSLVAATIAVGVVLAVVFAAF